jgi:hypothetical protein
LFNASVSIPVSEPTTCVCRVCGNPNMRRLARTGFLQRFILPWFGYYPWECFACRKTRLFRLRGKRTLKRIWDDDLYIPADEAELPVDIPELPANQIDLPDEQREAKQDASSSQGAE